jgi:protein arginine kinase activator
MSKEKGKNQVKISAKISGKEHELLLSSEKAEKMGFHSPLENGHFPLNEFLKLACENPTQNAVIPYSGLRCKQCGLTFNDFCDIGRFGCGACYDAFREKLEDLLTRIHGGNRHCGLIQADSSLTSATFLKMKRLNDELKHAVEHEDYERAAALRDQIKDLS